MVTLQVLYESLRCVSVKTNLEQKEDKIRYIHTDKKTYI